MGCSRLPTPNLSARVRTGGSDHQALPEHQADTMPEASPPGPRLAQTLQHTRLLASVFTAPWGPEDARKRVASCHPRNRPCSHLAG
ncbi:hypothetical protein GH733_008329 [Mirounga leonina]|nr:hypothetical protein GH733_008329 [Mirounga leonina]